VCSSAAGYYIGYLSPDGIPYSRESVYYWASEAGCQEALDRGTWQPRDTGWNPAPLTVTVFDCDSEPF
jgi:hypothetical protein